MKADPSQISSKRHKQVVTNPAIQEAELRASPQPRQKPVRGVKKNSQEIERRHSVSEGLRDILAVLNSNLTLEEILDFIVRQASTLLAADAVAIYRLSAEKGFLIVQASIGLDEEFLTRAFIPLGQSVTGQATQNRRPTTLSEINPAYLEEPGMDPEIRDLLRLLSARYLAILSVPLIIKSEVYGAISLYYRNRRKFLQDDVDLAVAFSDQAALAIENARLRAQVEQKAVADERNRLARDLHDSVTQTLFSANLIAEVVPVIWDNSPEDARRGLEELRQLTRSALAEMRALLLELRPSDQNEARLEDRLRRLVDAASARSRVPITLTIGGQISLPPAVETVFYRITQEALNNIIKHAGACRAQVSLNVYRSGPARLDRRVELWIRDNGCGFDLQKVTKDHLGLGIMRERAESVGASFTIHSEIGHGTQFAVVWKESRRNKTG